MPVLKCVQDVEKFNEYLNKNPGGVEDNGDFVDEEDYETFLKILHNFANHYKKDTWKLFDYYYEIDPKDKLNVKNFESVEEYKTFRNTLKDFKITEKDKSLNDFFNKYLNASVRAKVTLRWHIEKDICYLVKRFNDCYKDEKLHEDLYLNPQKGGKRRKRKSTKKRKNTKRRINTKKKSSKKKKTKRRRRRTKRR